MPLPTRTPCPDCATDTLHVWNRVQRKWQCNGCKLLREPPGTADKYATTFSALVRESNLRRAARGGY